MTEHRDPADPAGDYWHRLAWSAWHQLDATTSLVIQPKPGIYRLRCQGRLDLIYIGISVRLSSRLGALRRARGRPRHRGHSAAACVAGHEANGEVVEVSWALTEGIDRRELMGLEADLIAACRARFGKSPACQFHGRPLE